MIQIIEQGLIKASCDIVRPYAQISRGLALHSNYTPKVTPDLDTDSGYAIHLQCEVRIAIVNETACILTATHYAKVRVSQDMVDSASLLDKALLVTLPTILANDARATISRLSVMAGYPQAVLPMQNFDGLFTQLMANRPPVPTPLEVSGANHVH
ncbi:protein-export chaperone SecB [Acidithiobacillus ferrooxidans]|uniref:protein-export chaperone SecB n=1 Tax=Acidithiobacillus ferrooxidans TaxID=920 RepID=UPI000A76123A|nr:protein-export chaperone SecB [Acidithiobacillus ferrooxidans]